ncbi:ENTH-domain-containing protein [Auriscalpium vulgare]|uniref:ENTH-domain-containing protein n=1 Tax=Auriscalpium vulgare TaxID=40419 RepID=A0ACB8RS50_9AGAM|nr:ENTH-domain-containing protein [Auriscalpium vulgare]
MSVKGALRGLKNVTHGYSEAASKVRSATSNESLPPSGLQMHDIAVMSYNPTDLPDIIEQLEKRLNDKGKYWRHVYKSLSVIDYLLHSGAPAFASYFRQNIYIIKTLNEFQHIDENDRDVGADVRARAREVSRLLLDERRLAAARKQRQRMRDRMQGRVSTVDEEDEEEERPKAKPKPKQLSTEERELQRAKELSAKAEEERKRILAEQAKEGVFDDQKNDLIDLTIAQSEPQIQPQYTQVPTQYTSYSQPSYLQPQYTSVAAQYTAFDPYQQQAQYDAMVQAQYARQQAEAQQYASQYALQMQPTAQYIDPQPTAMSHGSNNPFAPASPAPSTSSSIYSPTASSVSLSHQYTSASTPALHRSSTASSYASSLPPPTPVSQPNLTGRPSFSNFASNDTSKSDLARLYASRTGAGDGVDTFGNAGALRYGGSAYGQLVAQRTGARGY